MLKDVGVFLQWRHVAGFQVRDLPKQARYDYVFSFRELVFRDGAHIASLGFPPSEEQGGC
jgi:hypothetical protein